LSELRNVAVVLAGGVGSRVGLNISKQLIKIAGRPIMEHTLDILNSHPAIDEVVVMMTPGYLDKVREIVKRNDFQKVSQILEGADNRNDTTQRALAALDDEVCNVILHDAVRPLLSPRIVTDVVKALDTHGAVDVAIPSADTIITVAGKEIDGYPVISSVPPRAMLRRGQTPQAFKLSVIRSAYAEAAMDPDFAATDDCSVVLKYKPEVPVAVVHGDDRNMKVTEPIDIYIADKLFQLTSNDVPAPSSEEEYRVALEGKTVVVFGGSYGIGADIAAMAARYCANVKIFSRSSTKTHVNRREDIVAARDQVLAETGRIDYVVNTAGVLPRGLLSETSDETIYESTEIN